MAEQLIISISGMRGIVGKNLTDSVAHDYGCAFGTFLKNSCPAPIEAGERPPTIGKFASPASGQLVRDTGKLSVCIGRDSRASGPMLESAVASGLCDTGIDVVDLAIVPTPSVGVMVQQLGCGGGIVITASHNPIQYNGIKLLLANSIAPPAEKAEQIKRLFLGGKFSLADLHNRGNLTSNEQTDAVHISKVLSIVDRRTIASKKFRVVLDSVNGAGGRITRKLLTELGCKVVAINDEPTGLFAHAPEPTAENLTGLCEMVKSEKAHIGFAQDPDADRLAVVDEDGIYIGEEYTLALAAKYIFSKRSGDAATNLSTSRMLDDIAKKAGGRVFRTPVGEAYVAAAMLEHNCIIGGEGNGGVIDLRVSPIRDSLVGIALVLQLMAETGKSISQLAAEIGGYNMIKTKFAANKAQAKKILSAAKKLFVNARLDVSDGYRFDFEDGWLHLRASNTEPVVRVIAEATGEETVRKYIDAVLKITR